MGLTRGKKWALAGAGLLLGGALLLALTPQGRDFRNLWNKGIIQALVMKEPPRELDATSEQNLRSLHRAMMNYHDSEGAFPDPKKWMDLVATRGEASDLAPGEADKKFHDPAAGSGATTFGFAMNAAAGGKFFDPTGKVEDDFEDPKMPLIFSSIETSRNASGDPSAIGRKGGLSITLDGSIVRLGRG